MHILREASAYCPFTEMGIPEPLIAGRAAGKALTLSFFLPLIEGLRREPGGYRER